MKQMVTTLGGYPTILHIRISPILVLGMKSVKDTSWSQDQQEPYNLKKLQGMQKSVFVVSAAGGESMIVRLALSAHSQRVGRALDQGLPIGEAAFKQHISLQASEGEDLAAWGHTAGRPAYSLLSSGTTH